MQNVRGSGGVLALALVCVSVTFTLTVLSLAQGLAVHQRVVAAADAAALAAADARLGFVVADACALATEVASAHQTQLVSCLAQGETMLVSVSAEVFSLTLTVTSRAGLALDATLSE